MGLAGVCNRFDQLMEHVKEWGMDPAKIAMSVFKTISHTTQQRLLPR